MRRLSGRRGARRDEGRFVIEGPTLVREALAADVVIDEAFLVPDADPALFAALEAVGASVCQIAPDLLARAVDTVSPQGVAAVARRVEMPLGDVISTAAAGPLVLVLVDVNDPGNAGTLLRAAEASGAAAVLFCGDAVDPWNPKCVRASAGALFHLPVTSGGDVLAVLDLLREAGVTTAATVVRGGVPHHEADLTGPVAVLVGSESHGLSDQVASAADLRLTIPIEGRSESLNAAMAGSVVVFEALRQRQASGK